MLAASPFIEIRQAGPAGMGPAIWRPASLPVAAVYARLSCRKASGLITFIRATTRWDEDFHEQLLQPTDSRSHWRA